MAFTSEGDALEAFCQFQWLDSLPPVGAPHQECVAGNSLVVQWLGLHIFTAEGAGSIPCWGTKIPQAVRHGQIKLIN